MAVDVGEAKVEVIFDANESKHEVGHVELGDVAKGHKEEDQVAEVDESEHEVVHEEVADKAVHEDTDNLHHEVAQVEDDNENGIEGYDEVAYEVAKEGQVDPDEPRRENEVGIENDTEADYKIVDEEVQYDPDEIKQYFQDFLSQFLD